MRRLTGGLGLVEGLAPVASGASGLSRSYDLWESVGSRLAVVRTSLPYTPPTSHNPMWQETATRWMGGSLTVESGLGEWLDADGFLGEGAAGCCGMGAQ